MASKNDENWFAFFSELQAYIEAHGHLPDKHVVENRGLLSKAKYLRKKIKTGTAEDICPTGDGYAPALCSGCGGEYGGYCAG